MLPPVISPVMTANLPIGFTNLSAPGSPPVWDGDRMFNIYLHDYFQKRGFHKAASQLLAEADILEGSIPPINAKEGLLFEWWSAFWTCFRRATQPTQRQGQQLEIVEWLPGQSIVSQQDRWSAPSHSPPEPTSSLFHDAAAVHDTNPTIEMGQIDAGRAVHPPSMYGPLSPRSDSVTASSSPEQVAQQDLQLPEDSERRQERIRVLMSTIHHSRAIRQPPNNIRQVQELLFRDLLPMTQTGSPVEAKHGVDDDDNLSTSTIRKNTVDMAQRTYMELVHKLSGEGLSCSFPGPPGSGLQCQPSESTLCRGIKRKRNTQRLNLEHLPEINDTHHRKRSRPSRPRRLSLQPPPIGPAELSFSGPQLGSPEVPSVLSGGVSSSPMAFSNSQPSLSSTNHNILFFGLGEGTSWDTPVLNGGHIPYNVPATDVQSSTSTQDAAAWSEHAQVSADGAAAQVADPPPYTSRAIYADKITFSPTSIFDDPGPPSCSSHISMSVISDSMTLSPSQNVSAQLMPIDEPEDEFKDFCVHLNSV
ncbi:hypothetical protein AcV5_009047 [Taiwanofungus camphoratus]|nr:hypothetical protein AcV5_009047 [Antrodia cinnamomea]